MDMITRRGLFGLLAVAPAVITMKPSAVKTDVRAPARMLMEELGVEDCSAVVEVVYPQAEGVLRKMGLRI